MFRDIYEYLKLPKEVRRTHLNLAEACVEIGGRSDQFRGLLAHFLKTTIPFGKQFHLCHACNNGACSNPSHMYWGTNKDNFEDSVGKIRAAAKIANQTRIRQGVGVGVRGVPLPIEIRKKLSDATRNKPKPWQRKVVWPSPAELSLLVWKYPMIVIAKQFGVSDSTVKSWISKYKIAKPPRGYWSKPRE
jgi:hypothetical protein